MSKASPAKKVSPPKDVRDVLLKAVRHVKRVGWTQNKWCADKDDVFDSACCANAAIWLAAGVDPYHVHVAHDTDRHLYDLCWEAERRLARWILGNLGISGIGSTSDEVICYWNDKYVADVDEVVVGMKAAANGSDNDSDVDQS